MESQARRAQPAPTAEEVGADIDTECELGVLLAKHKLQEHYAGLCAPHHC